MRNRLLFAGWAIGVAVAVFFASAPQHVLAEPPMPIALGASASAPGPHTDDPVTVMIPVAGIVTTDLRDTFVEARTGHVHGAIDILAPRGTPVVAAIDGHIRKLFTSRAGGLTIYQSDPDETRMFYYAHLDRYADGLAEGARVTRGTVIGYVGTTGNAPINTPHLHFAIAVLPPTKEWWKGTAIDPYPILVRGRL
jgi:murein DD-endopeptidase MepM/ murein hydrolase activator NlpD